MLPSHSLPCLLSPIATTDPLGKESSSLAGIDSPAVCRCQMHCTALTHSGLTWSGPAVNRTKAVASVPAGAAH